MPYSNVVGRGDTAALVPEDVANDMLGHVATENSAVLKEFKRVPVLSGQTRFPILSALPFAYWVNGDTGLRQTTEEQWSNKFMNIEELAVVVPVPENVIDDVADEGGFDLWSEIMPDCEIAIGRALDSAVFFGTNSPSTFPPAVSIDAAARGFEYEEASATAEGGIQNDIDVVIGELEEAGFDPSGIVAARTLRGKLRKARSTIGERLSGVNADLTEYMGMSISYPMRGLFPTGAKRVEAFVGDYTEFAVGVRKDIEVSFLDEAVLQDNTGAIVVNLAQQKMVAMMLTCRYGWQVSNKIRYDQTDETKRYPVGVLKSKT
jgi:HK97 family phage major capsid protein